MYSSPPAHVMHAQVLHDAAVMDSASKITGIFLLSDLTRHPHVIDFDATPNPLRFTLGSGFSRHRKCTIAGTHTRQHAEYRLVARRPVLRPPAQSVLADPGRIAGPRSTRDAVSVATASAARRRHCAVGCAAVLPTPRQPGCRHRTRFDRR